MRARLILLLVLVPALALATEHEGVLGEASINTGETPAPAQPARTRPIFIPRMQGPTHRGGAHTAAGALSPRTASNALRPMAPALVADFIGITDTGFFPPDPQIAAGPSDLIAVVNGGIARFAKDGTKMQQRTLDEFFNVPSSSTRFTFDPKILYDPHSSRCFVVAIQGQSSPDSVLHVAVSKSDNPSNLSAGASASQEWYGFEIDADRDGGTQKNNNWADFPGLGVDQFNLYLTANMFSNAGDFRYVKVWIIPKAGLLAGGPITPYEFGAPPKAALSNPASGQKDFTIIPALNFDATNEHLLATHKLSPDGNLTLWTVNNPSGTPTLSSQNLLVDSWNGETIPLCPQLGGATPLDTADTRVLNVVERGGSLWAAHTQPSADGARSEARWYQIDPAAPSVMQVGQVGDATRCYFYPAIHPDSQGNASIVMSGVDATIWGSAFYTGRLVDDAPGTMAPVTALKMGLASYDVPDGNGINRWGDFGGIAADPVSDDIWMIHEYAAATPDEWSTWIGRKPAAVPLPPTFTATPTPTRTATRSASPTRTLTGTRTPVATITRTTPASVTPTASATASATATTTVTVTAPPTATITPFPPGLRGDVNCDLRVSVADTSALVMLLPSAGLGACGRGDVTQDGQVTAADLAATIELIFDPER